MGGARTAVITVPFLRSSVEQERVDADRRWINEALRKFAAQNPAERLLIDLAAAMPQDAAHRALWDADGVHFEPAGYAAMGDVIGDALIHFERTLHDGAPPTGRLDACTITRTATVTATVAR